MATITLIIISNSYLDWNNWLEVSVGEVKIGVWGRKGLPMTVKEREVKPIQVSGYFFFKYWKRSVKSMKCSNYSFMESLFCLPNVQDQCISSHLASSLIHLVGNVQHHIKNLQDFVWVREITLDLMLSPHYLHWFQLKKAVKMVEKHLLQDSTQCYKCYRILLEFFVEFYTHWSRMGIHYTFCAAPESLFHVVSW